MWLHSTRVYTSVTEQGCESGSVRGPISTSEDLVGFDYCDDCSLFGGVSLVFMSRMSCACSLVCPSSSPS